MTERINSLYSNGIGQANVNNSVKAASGTEGSEFREVLNDVSADAAKSSGKVSLNDIFQKAADTYNVPVKLLKAMAKAESNFNPNAVSSCGAQGIMQLMPATSKALGVTDPFDPEQNIMGGAKYISGKLAQYNGNVNLALAAYQAGSGNVAKYGGIPPFESTRTYIRNINKYMNSSDITNEVYYNPEDKKTVSEKNKAASPAYGSTDNVSDRDAEAIRSLLSMAGLSALDVSAVENMTASELLSYYRMHFLSSLLFSGSAGLGYTNSMFSSSDDDGLLGLMGTYSRYNMLSVLSAMNQSDNKNNR